MKTHHTTPHTSQNCCDNVLAHSNILPRIPHRHFSNSSYLEFGAQKLYSSLTLLAFNFPDLMASLLPYEGKRGLCCRWLADSCNHHLKAISKVLIVCGEPPAASPVSLRSVLWLNFLFFFQLSFVRRSFGGVSNSESASGKARKLWFSLIAKNEKCVHAYDDLIVNWPGFFGLSSSATHRIATTGSNEIQIGFVQKVKKVPMSFFFIENMSLPSLFQL